MRYGFVAVREEHVQGGWTGGIASTIGKPRRPAPETFPFLLGHSLPRLAGLKPQAARMVAMKV